MSYSGYLAQLPNKKQFVQDMTRMIIADDFMKHGKSGHYYLKHQQDEKGNAELGYVPALEEDVNMDGLVIAFDSKFLRKSSEKVGFQVESFMCLSATGKKTKCYDDLDKSCKIAFDYNEKTFFNSNFIAIEAIKPIQEDYTIEIYV